MRDIFAVLFSLGLCLQMWGQDRILDLNHVSKTGKVQTEAQVIGKSKTVPGVKVKDTDGTLKTVYQTVNGKYFIVKRSRNGNFYKKYIELK